jgi:hypothetical protein
MASTLTFHLNITTTIDNTNTTTTVLPDGKPTFCHPFT